MTEFKERRWVTVAIDLTLEPQFDEAFCDALEDLLNRFHYDPADFWVYNFGETEDEEDE